MTAICEPHDLAFGFSAQHGIHDCSPGLTKRELFAAMAMQGLIQSGNWGLMEDVLASRAIVAADALIVELSK